jgi:hypothetical protein
LDQRKKQKGQERRNIGRDIKQEEEEEWGNYDGTDEHSTEV